MKCYIASPFFDEIAIQEVETVKELLEELNIEYFSPKDHNLCEPDAPEEKRKEVFEKNIKEISNCDFMIANTRNKDIGTSIEIGYAFSNDKPVILFCPQVRNIGINLMLANLCRGFSYDKEELKNRIEEFLKNINSPTYNNKIE